MPLELELDALDDDSEDKRDFEADPPETNNSTRVTRKQLMIWLICQCPQSQSLCPSDSQLVSHRFQYRS